MDPAAFFLVLFLVFVLVLAGIVFATRAAGARAAAARAQAEWAEKRSRKRRRYPLFRGRDRGGPGRQLHPGTELQAGHAAGRLGKASQGRHRRKSPTPTAQPGPNTSQPVPTTTSSSAPSPSATAEPTDYTGLLIQATDINAPVSFTRSPPTNNPNGKSGVATTFSDQDASHVIKDTIRVLSARGAATSALNAAKATRSNAIKDPTTGSANVGSGGTTLSGNTPDGSKGVLILLFTEGKAFVTLEFVGPSDSLPPEDFVNDVGQKQDAAVKKGLGG
jgi:hypothetical protein